MSDNVPQKHILLVEDDPAIATSLKVTFKRENWQLTWLDHVSAVLPKLEEIYAAEQTDANCAGMDGSAKLSAIILDVGLPDGDGLSLCQSIRDCDSIGNIKNLPILFLTARSEEIDRILGLEMGADDYCAKPFSPRELIARIKAIWRRQVITSTEASIHNSDTNNASKQTTDNAEQHFTLSSGNWRFVAQTYQLFWNDSKLLLSNTERKLLLYMLQNAQQVFSREQLLSAVSDHPDHRLARTVDSHIKSIRKTLAQIDPNTEVIHTHRGIGYGLCAP